MENKENDDEDFETKYPSKNLKVLHNYDTVLCSDSIEWCPQDPYQNFFVCANYQLKESQDDKPSERFGRILLFSSSNDELTLHQTIDTAAVLDQKWCHNAINGFPVLAVTNALKTLEVYKLNPETRLLEFVARKSVDDGCGETLLLSLDWCTGKIATQEPEIVCSDSKGKMHIFRFEGTHVELINSYHGHDYEAWIAAFYYWDPFVFFTGGDDSLFLKFDTRIGKSPVAKNRSHEAGVTSLHSNFSKEHVLASGSYDGFTRLWDTRQMKTPTSRVQLPGTMWRLKWDPFEQTYLLAASMHGGVHVIDALNLDEPEVVDSFYGHKNIAYGADWCFKKSETGVVIGTCSFYDHLLCVSSVNLGRI